MTPDPIPHPAEVLRKVVEAALRFSDRAAGEGIFFVDGGDPADFLHEAYADCENPLEELIGRVTAALTPVPTPHPAPNAVDVLRSLEWSQVGQSGWRAECPICGQYRLAGHHPNCRLAAALTPDPAKAGHADEMAALRAAVEGWRTSYGQISDAFSVANDVISAERSRAMIAEARVKVLEEAHSAGNYLIDRLQRCHSGKPVRDLGEATVAYENAARRAALSQIREGCDHGE